MAKGLRSAENCQVLASRPSLTFRNGDYAYEIVRESGRSLYKVTYRDESVVRPLITHRFLASKSMVVYVSDGRETPAGDLDHGSSELVGDGLIERLVSLVSGPPLKLVAEQ
jgi:hypothetical protein